MNYVKYAREVARASYEMEKKTLVLICADDLELALNLLSLSWSLDDMRKAVGAFTRCVKAVQRITEPGGGNPVGGRLPLADVQRKAA